MNLPPEATAAPIDFMGAQMRYGRLLDALSLAGIEPPHPSFDKCEAYIRDAEQALIAIFSAVLGEPDASA